MAMRERAAGWLWLGVWPWGWLVGAIVVFGAFGTRPVTAQQSSSSCPLDFTVLEKFPGVATQARVKEVQCLTLIDGLEMVLAAYVRNTSYFLLPPEVVPACLADYQAQLRAQGTDANVTGLCELDLPAMLSRGHDNCQGIQRTSDLAAIASRYKALQSAQQSCAGPLADDNMRQTVACSACIRQLASLTTDLQAFNASGVQQGCQNYSSLYAAAVINTAGPLDPKTAACLFAIFPVPAGKKKLTGVYVAVGAIGMALLGFAVALSFYYKHRRRKLAEGRAFIKRNTDLLDGSMRSSDGSIMFTIDELKAATRNFSRDTIIGSGAYGNVYKGVLISGVEVAIKVIHRRHGLLLSPLCHWFECVYMFLHVVKL